MDYNETVTWIFNQIPQYQNIGKKAYKADLTNSLLLANHLGNPEKKIKTIHIGGTNGKGSTSSMIASVLQESGYKVGLFTSPHLKDFRERIKVNGKEISESFVVDFIEENQQFITKNSFSFFELTFAMASYFFVQQQVDVAIIEVGLGGALDSTNIISPILSVITNIGWDHQNILGDSLAAIAQEKAGIIKTQTPVVVGEYLPETAPIFIEKAQKMAAPIWMVDDIKISKNYPCDLKGNYQEKNKKTASVAINCLKEHFLIDENAISQGFLNVAKNTGLQGRWQQLNEQPLTIADTAHNEMGIKEVVNQIKEQSFEKLHIVFGMVQDKEVEKIINLLPKDAFYYLSCPNISRGIPVDKLSEVFENLGYSYQTFESIEQAYNCAKTNAKENDFIYIGGSTFVVAEII